MILTHTFDVVPVPASRPRVSKWGTYYGKTYKAFRKAMAEALADWNAKPLQGPLRVVIKFSCKKPKKLTKSWPRGDVDNYVKALFDSFNGVVWVDDDQVLQVQAEKIYVHDCDPRIDVWIYRGEVYE